MMAVEMMLMIDAEENEGGDDDSEFEDVNKEL